jgi:hypothetical protein
MAYDAAGQRIAESESTFSEEGTMSVVTLRKFDGDGQIAIEDGMAYCNTCPPPTSNATYYVRSSLLGGQPVAVVNRQAETKWRYVYANGELIASSGNGYAGSSGIEWRHDTPSGSGIFRTYASFGADGVVERTELDPVRADVGTENPYTGGGGAGSPNSGDLTSRLADATDFSRCSRDGFLMPCERVLNPGVEDTIKGIGHERNVRPVCFQDPDTGEVKCKLGIYDSLPDGGHGYVPIGAKFLEGDWIDVDLGDGDTGGGRVRSTSLSGTFLYHARHKGGPQNRGFLVGRFGFNQNELNRLAKAYERVDTEACHKFFDDMLADLRKRGQIAPQGRFTPSTLQAVLNITTLNKYSSNLTARQVGVSQKSWAEVQANFGATEGTQRYSGVTLADGRVFLSSNAFYISGPIEGLFGVNSADLSGIIVHEFFHRAGLSEDQIKPLHSEIQKNCGIRGFAL